MFRFADKMVKRRIVGGILLVVFLSVMSLSLFDMPVATAMNMEGNTSDCPFASRTAVFCSMGVLDHVGAWKSSFVAIVPSFTLLLSVLVSTITLLALATTIFVRQKHKSLLLSKSFTQRIYSFSYRPLQELFSSGILHPKLF